MTQKELLESVLSELTSIKREMPNGELRQMAESIKDMKEDISELKYMLLNPEDGIVVKVNKNTEFRKFKEDRIPYYDGQIQLLTDIIRWKEGVNKALWIMFAALIGIIVKLLFNIEIPDA